LDFVGTTVFCDWILKNKNDATDLERQTNYCPRSAINTACCASCAGIEVAA
jgi:hypothetical protein